MVSEEEAPMKDVEFLIGEEIVKETGGDCWETPGSLKKTGSRKVHIYQSAYHFCREWCD